MAEKEQYVYLKVHPVVFEYFKSTYGECIDLSRNNTLSHRIAYLLEKVKPRDYKAYKMKRYKILRLKLHRFNLAGTRIEVFGQVNFLDDFRQYQISKELERQFKDAFHSQVLGYCRAGGMQSEGIKDFCQIRSIPCDHINFEMLKKSWDRSDEKKELKNLKKGYQITPNLSLMLFQ